MKDCLQAQIFPSPCYEGFTSTYADLIARWMRAKPLSRRPLISGNKFGQLTPLWFSPDGRGVGRYVWHKLAIDNLSFPPPLYQENIFGVEPPKSLILLVARRLNTGEPISLAELVFPFSGGSQPIHEPRRKIAWPRPLLPHGINVPWRL